MQSIERLLPGGVDKSEHHPGTSLRLEKTFLPTQHFPSYFFSFLFFILPAFSAAQRLPNSPAFPIFFSSIGANPGHKFFSFFPSAEKSTPMYQDNENDSHISDTPAFQSPHCSSSIVSSFAALLSVRFLSHWRAAARFRVHADLRISSEVRASAGGGLWALRRVGHLRGGID